MRLEHHLTAVLLGEAERKQAPSCWTEPLASLRAQRAGPRGDARTGYIEVRLSEGSGGRVDLLTHTSARQRRELASSLPGSDDWQSLQAFCAEWSRYGSPLGDVAGLWLEYDDAGADGEKAPSAHFSLIPDAVRVKGPIQPYDAAAWKKIELAASLLGADATHIAAFQARTQGLPMVYIGVMTSRTPATLKGYLVIAAAEFEGACERLGWRDSARVLNEFRQWTDGSPASNMYVDFTFDARGGVQLALVFPQQYVLAGEASDRRGFVEKLVKRGYCDPAHAEFLSSWAGQGLLDTQHGLGQRLKRWLDLKVAYGDVTCAKAYLGVETRNATWTGTD